MNSTTTRRWGIRLTAGVGALTLGALALSSPAMAAPPEYGNVDTSKTDASLTIHKHEHQTAPIEIGDPAGPGEVLPNPIAGVTFTAYPITDLPLDVASSWDTLSALDAATAVCPVPNTTQPAAAIPGRTLGPAIPFGPTNAAGTSTKILPVAAYLVCETGHPVEISEPAQPFIVTIPFPDNQVGAPANSSGWLYQVHAYPKNAKAVTVTKTVAPQGSAELGIGSLVEFPTTVGIPRIKDANQFTSFSIVDPMDPRLTDITTTTVTVDGVPVDPNYYEKKTERNVLMVNFTQAGLTWLKGQGGKDVVVTFTGTVGSLAKPAGTGLEDGKIYNRAYLMTDNKTLAEPPATPTVPVLPPSPDPVDPTDPKFPPGPPTTPSNPVTSYWGDIKILKHDNQAAPAAPAPLSGAVFEVYEAAAPYDSTCASARPTGAAPLSIGGKTRFETINGLVTIPGVFVSDSEKAPVDAQTRCYVIKEVAAPAGFVLPTGEAAFTPVTVSAGLTASTTPSDVTVVNTKQDVPNLPLTGAQGQLFLMIGGAALIATAMGAALIARRRAQKKA